MAKKVELGQSGLGDISDLLHNRGLSDLSWLNVDPEDYHKAEALPKQNLDMIPELQRALTFEEGNVPSLIPLRPHTMVNTNPLDPPGSPARDTASEITNRVARHLISGHDPKHIGERIMLEFAPSQIREASQRISSVLSERGLIGNVYIDSRHFPRCDQDGDDKKFVAARAANTKYVLAKSECSGCIHNHGGNCASLHKTLVSSVSYDRKTFASFAAKLAQEGRLEKSSLDKAISGTDSDRKKVLQASFCSYVRKSYSDHENRLTLRQQDKVKKPVVSEKDIAEYLSKPRKASPVLSRGFVVASKHLMLGGDPSVISASTDPEVRKLVSSYGLLGHTYLDMEALGGCQKTLDFMSKMDSVPDFVVRRSSHCDECNDVSDGTCSQISSVSPIVDTDNINKEHFVAALLRASDRGAITVETARRAATKASKKSNWRSLTSQANLLSAKKAETPYIGSKVAAYLGARIPDRDSVPARSVGAEEVRKSISHLMNLGMSGKTLQSAILKKYAREDLMKVSHIGAELSGHDGAQGSYFVDPTAYSDYGRGCSTGSKHFRKRGASNLLVGEMCTGCSMQTAPGWCAKYAKSLIRHIPESVVMAAVENKNRPVIMDDTPVENPVDRYELSSEVLVEPNKKTVLPDVGFPSRSVSK